MPFLSELVAGRRERIPQPMSDIFRVYTCKILCIEQPNLISLLYLLSYLILCSEFPVISSLIPGFQLVCQGCFRESISFCMKIALVNL